MASLQIFGVVIPFGLAKGCFFYVFYRQQEVLLVCELLYSCNLDGDDVVEFFSFRC